MKFIIIILLIAGGIWAYLNIDFTNLKTNVQNGAMNSIKNEKTINKFLNSDKQGKEQLEKTLQENF